MTSKIIQRFIDGGVEFIDANRVTIGEDVQIGKGTIIYPNVTILGNTRLAEQSA